VPCGTDVRYYLSGDVEVGGSFPDPSGAPDEPYVARAVDTTVLALRDDVEGDVSGWTVIDQNVATGTWAVAEPNATFDGVTPAAPGIDATKDPGVRAFVTQNGVPGGSQFDDDVDGGPTILVSPAVATDGRDARVSFARWFYTNDEPGQGDELRVEISTDGGAIWTPVPALTTTGTDGAWEHVSFFVGDEVALGATVQLRFLVQDQPNDSVTEAGIDDFEIDLLDCACPADFDGSGDVGFEDLTPMLGFWGPCPGCAADLSGDAVVSFADLTALLAAWGPC
jgi:hypothetical protein